MTAVRQPIIKLIDPIIAKFVQSVAGKFHIVLLTALVFA